MNFARTLASLSAIASSNECRNARPDFIFSETIARRLAHSLLKARERRETRSESEKAAHTSGEKIASHAHESECGSAIARAIAHAKTAVPIFVSSLRAKMTRFE
ncbi:MAG: hypothetical protein V4760_06060 [Bdellovibrionota bacterium]